MFSQMNSMIEYLIFGAVICDIANLQNSRLKTPGQQLLIHMIDFILSSKVKVNDTIFSSISNLRKSVYSKPVDYQFH